MCSDKKDGQGFHSRHMAMMMGWVMWVVIVVGVATIWLLSNYDLIPANTWNWLAPVGFFIIALASIISCPMMCCKGKKSKCGSGNCCESKSGAYIGGDCKDGNCEDEKCEDGMVMNDMKKDCKCGGVGPCQCPGK